MKPIKPFLAAIVLAGCSIALADDVHEIHGADLDAIALDGRAFDAVTGRDQRNYPHDAQVNYQHLKLDIVMKDPMSRSFTCNETLTFRTPMNAVDHLDLDCVGLQIQSITDLNNQKLSFRQDEKTITVRFEKPIPAETDAGLKVAYTCKAPPYGMMFTLPDKEYPNRPLSIHTHGETETNRYWFISHDWPNTRFSSEIIVTIPSKYAALANGALIEKKEAGDDMTTWHYKLAKPHTSYLVSLVIGDLKVVSEKWRDKPVEYWVPADQVENAQRTFGRTTKMLELFSNLLGVEYPWEKYAQSVVYNFHAGGMENTSVTTLVETTSLDERAFLDTDADNLIAHELAHQWFGDMITCKSWPHLWLNEGFATFMADIWQENANGPEAAQQAVWRNALGVVEIDDALTRGGVVWPFYEGSRDLFARPVSNAYRKGSAVLHMLRLSLGDKVFWKMLNSYLTKHAFHPVETVDLRMACDEASGRSYEQFFQQWIYRAGSPRIKLNCEWNDAEKEVRVSVEQTQPISADAPAFSMEIPVWIVDADGKVARHVLNMDGRVGGLTVKCDSEPAQVAIDPQGATLAKWESKIPTTMLLNQAMKGPTPRSRFDAISQLAAAPGEKVRQALKSILVDDNQHYTYRMEAAAALAKMHDDKARDILIAALAEGNAIKEPRARRAAVAALGEYRSAAVVPTLLRFAAKDETYTVEGIACESLGRQDRTDEIVNALLEDTKKESYRDQIRIAAVLALGNLGEPRGLAPAIALSSYGSPFRSREFGLAAVAKIGAAMEKKDEARNFLIKICDDPQERSAAAAIRALGDLGDAQAIPALKTIVDSSATKVRRDAAKATIDTISKKGGESDVVKALRERIESLEKARSGAESKGRAPVTTP